MSTRRNWTKEELLVAFRLYCNTAFGRLHQRNPDIIQIAEAINRTPSAVAMKACNFASLDPVQQARKISALGNTSKGDRELWEWFDQSPNEVAEASEAAFESMVLHQATPQHSDELDIPDGPTEVERVVKTRRVQRFFRDAVLTSYNHRCAISGLAIDKLLIASHIIPWSKSPDKRADPRNGIALNSIYDRAFDQGLLTFDDQLKVVLSKQLKDTVTTDFHRDVFTRVEGQALHNPTRFSPDEEAMNYHRNHIFKD